MSAQAVATHALDVMSAASRRRTLWFYLICSTVLVGALVLGADLSVELRRVEAVSGVALPRTIALDPRVLPGSVRVEAGDLLAPGSLRLHDDGAGKLGDGSHGTVDYALGIVSLVGGADAAPVVSDLTVKYVVSLVGLDGAAHARALAEGTATTLTLFGAHVQEDRALPVEYAAPYLLLVILFNGILVKVLASFFGVLLGLLATNDAVSSALEPGAVEMHLSRPVARGEVVVGRFLGGLGFGLVQVGWLLGLAVLLAGIKFGVWVPSALLLAGPMLLKFAVLLALVTLVTVWTRTAALGLAAGALAWVLSFACYFMQARAARGDVQLELAGAVAWLDRLVYALPPVAHLDDLASAAVEIPITDGPQTSVAVVLVLATAWVIAPVAVAIGVVSRRDY